MQLRTSGMSLPVAIVVASAILIALTAAPSISSASTTPGENLAQTTIGMAASSDTLEPHGTAGSAPLQMMNGDNDWDTGWWIVMAVMMVLFWGAVIVAIFWGMRQLSGDRRRDRSALDIAKERLARGELTKEEFDRIRSDLA